ncbi:protein STRICTOSIDINE SYNTHASE-LIKE 5-like [Selaginella moellendorffii]|uniref:protein STRICTOSIDINE SYNTHASE-LIKE 5-like n=1 Tax=Selaginella moellendorffii TaxID=88036 RepID=UPI000D1CC284|nr:protein STRICTOSIDINE SYNTHASE-LIKE 5-like [Selaginella moellendorffii]|eukprot:XP_024522779.1 protein STRICTOSIDINE SYNTHASE-LIKE 5-like [Selaginella moellendorffii]
MEVFIDNLPGHPDNIRHNGQDRFWIGLVAGRTRLTDTLMKIAPLKHILALPGVLQKISASSKMAKVLAVGQDGVPLAFYEDPTGKLIALVTTALEVGDYLYLGNLARNYVGKLKLRQL